MTELVVDIPNDIAEEMKRLRFINWNEKLVKDILLFLNEREIVESILAKSKLNEKDAEEIDDIIFYLPELVLAELLKHKELLCRKTGLSQKEVFFTMENIDIKDSEFVALALSIENDGIFSNDKHFDDSRIKRWTVNELVSWLERH